MNFWILSYRYISPLLLFPLLKWTGTAEAIQFLIYTESELKTQILEPHANRTPRNGQECTCI